MPLPAYVETNINKAPTMCQLFHTFRFKQLSQLFGWAYSVLSCLAGLTCEGVVAQRKQRLRATKWLLLRLSGHKWQSQVCTLRTLFLLLLQMNRTKCLHFLSL